MMSLRKLIEKYHNPDLIHDPIVHHIYNDGEISRTKGGDLYGLRSVHVEFDPNFPDKFVPLSSLGVYYDKSIFPNTEFGYAIMSLENAIEVRKIMSGQKS